MNRPTRWDPKTNCITDWYVPGWPDPLHFTGWGCEVGNGFGFFAHERLGGFACRIENSYLGPVEQNRLGSSWSIALPRARLSLEVFDEMVSPYSIERKLTVSNIGSKLSWVGDAVLRMVVPHEQGMVAEIGDKVIEHTDRDFYYDTEEPLVALRWPDGRKIVVSWLHRPNAPPAFTPYLYIRDQPAAPTLGHAYCMKRAWVIHARLLVDYPAAFVYRWARNPVVVWSRGLLGRFFISPHRVGHRWRADEWKLSDRGSLMGIWPLYAEESLSMTVRCETKRG